MAMTIFSFLRGGNSDSADAAKSKQDLEIERLNMLPHEEIKDIDIRENTKFKLHFRKMPWEDWTFCLIFMLVAIIVYGVIDLRKVKGLL